MRLMCVDEDAVNVFLNPWGLSQLSIQLKVQTHYTTQPSGKNQSEKAPTCCAVRPSRGDVMCSRKQQAVLGMLSLLMLLLLSNGVNVYCATVHENIVDLQALLDFNQSITSDPNRALGNWSIDTHFCRWNGVNCTETRPFRVLSLNLTSQNLAGQITPSLGNLSFLKTLDLSNNQFVGSLPLLNHLQHLQVLFLGSNLLQGTFPDALTNCSSLIILDLSHNMLTGVIPPRIGNLTNLTGLSLRRNNFTGIIPPALGTITTLTQLDLSENQLSGQIPNEIWQMPNIIMLALDENSLSGGIPRSLPNISSLRLLSMPFNMLGGALPSNIGDALPSLQLLYLAGNTFEGHIPASLGNASMLEQIDFSSNKFTGQIPTSLGKLSELTSLSLQKNELEAKDSEGWEFFHALTNCRRIKNIVIDNNHLQGGIPNSIGNMSNLEILLMGGNNLSGIVPPSIGKLHNLIKLSLDYNNLTGTIETWVGQLINLQSLTLDGNNFIGTFPPSISNFAHLTSFSISKNAFTGLIPPTLGTLQRLTKLNLSSNNFQGTIPVEFGSLKQLISLDLSSNKLSGEIPETLGQCQQLVTIRMDQNVLIGNIPTTFSNLYSLGLLNLSHNNLSGPLPANLNDLKLLTKLDLSYNTFQGEIPTSGVFGNATVVLLDGNSGLCGGNIELHMPPCHAVARRARRTSYLVKILIPIFGFLSLVLLVYLLLLVKKSSSRRNFHSESSFGEHFHKVTYQDLAQATSDFSESNLIGSGGYGSVYRGNLKETKMEVAVKVFNLETRGAERSFMAECEALRRIQHRNLLPIITACSTVDNVGNVFKALIYEFMPNGNLDMWLHHKGSEEDPKLLGLTQRISIAVNIADALDYLHNDCGRPTVHCDLKPSNILLDDDMNALLGDFGIARFYANSKSTWAGSTSSIGLKGTIGYIPPEYGGGGHPSMSGDVYSFGIVLLEILTGKRPTDPIFVDGMDIVSFVDNSLPDQIFHVIDAHLLEECKIPDQQRMVSEKNCPCLLSLLQVALACARAIPSERWNMKQVASTMHAIKESYVGKEDKKHTSVQ